MTDTEILRPRANPELVGHEAAERDLRRLFESGRLPHALLISGPRGIGKATLAFRLARFVLTPQPGSLFGDAPAAGEGLWTDPEGGVFRRIAAGGHADVLTVERAFDPRRKRLRSEIVVADTREIGNFLHLTPAEGGWRVVIVDGADAMNRNAANALLKILEEPPRQTLLLLVAHSAGRLLPTIRSRCRRFPLAALSSDVVREMLTRHRPDLTPADADAIVALSGGSIGAALDLVEAGGVELYRAALSLIRPAQELDIGALHAFADKLARADAEDAYRVVEDLIGQFLARLAVATARGDRLPGAEGEAAGRVRAPAARWAGLRDEIAGRFARTDGLNLDKKQTILGTFFAIGEAAG
jgi:DNA polymerase-3 subunit delta'